MKGFRIGSAIACLLITAACTQTGPQLQGGGTAATGVGGPGRDGAAPLAETAAANGPRPKLAVHDAMRIAPAVMAMPMSVPGPVVGLPRDLEHYAAIDENGVVAVREQPVSTFSIDVDTASYANVRRILNEGRLPPRDAVRVEEFVNYFTYHDALPSDRSQPFRVTTTIAPTPWNAATRLLRIAVRAWDVAPEDLPASNLVFLVDVSGSMQQPDKLPLLKRSLKLLTRRMNADDRISLVVYAGASGVVLEPTAGDQHATIEAAIDDLQAGGPTHGSAGIQLAYAKAREAFIDDGINRVILATDGDFNVGTVDHRALVDLVARERKTGVALTTLGFGRGNLKDGLLEQLADQGDGNYAYIDTLLEARKVLVEQMGGTLATVAGDVKIQVEFNPARVAEYRLVGYENRLLRREDFANDRVDAGELGAGHSVVALYELALVGDGGYKLEPLRYADRSTTRPASGHGDEYAFVKLRYKLPGEADSRLVSHPVADAAYRVEIGQADDDFRFSAAVAAFAQRLRGGTHLGDYGYRDILQLARAGRGSDENGYRAEFVRMIGLAESLDSYPTGNRVPDDNNG